MQQHKTEALRVKAGSVRRLTARAFFPQAERKYTGVF